MKFWDASAVVAMLAGEPPAENLLELFESDPDVVAWWGTSVECASAFSRLEREGALDADATNELFGDIGHLAGTWFEVQPTNALRATATRLLRVHGLRAADSLQLAAAMTVASGDPRTVDLVSLDQRLNEAARREGFRVFEPSGDSR